MSRNKDYWERFYQSAEINCLDESSDFAKFTLRHLREKESFVSLLDIGCGNGRDTRYFRENGIAAHGIDLSCVTDSPYFYKEDALSTSRKCDVYYLRFFVHTLDERQLDIFTENIYNIMPSDSSIFIETRSSRDIVEGEKGETNFRSKIGTEHFRMLYARDYLEKKFKKYFDVPYCVESKGLAPFQGEDPYIIRMILTHKKSGNRE